jgi:ATP-dependent Clp protease, protease subunit
MKEKLTTENFINQSEQGLDPSLEDVLKGLGDNNWFKQEFLNSRKIFLWGAVHDSSARDIVNRLLYLEAKDPGEEITLYINSPGGVVTSGMIIYDTMQMISSPVATVCIGLAASMGSIILSGGEKGKRSIWTSGKVMIHQPSIGQLFGQASDLQIQAKQINKTKKMSAEVLAHNCNQELNDVMTDFDRDYWMNANESLEYGIVDNVSTKTGF